MGYEEAVALAREGCCDELRKPCVYHDGFGDGYDQAEVDRAEEEKVDG